MTMGDEEELGHTGPLRGLEYYNIYMFILKLCPRGSSSWPLNEEHAK